MAIPAYVRSRGVFLPLALLASATTMLWLFWRYPKATLVVALIVLSALTFSAKFTRGSDTDGSNDVAPPEQGAQSR